jgi:hypothetical protein
MQFTSQLLLALLPLASFQKPAPVPAQAPGATTQAASDKRGYSALSVQLEFGGHVQTLSSFGGTTLRLDNGVSADGRVASRSAQSPRCDDVRATVPLLADEHLQKWMGDALADKPISQEIKFVELDAAGVGTFEHSMRDASIRAIELQRLEAGSKDQGRGWDVVFAASELKWQKAKAKAAPSLSKQKQSAIGGFRMQIDGVELARLAEVGPIRVECGLAASASGKSRLGQGLRVMPIELRVNDNDPSYWTAWLDETRSQGAALRTATLELLDPSMKEVLVRVELNDVSLASVGRMGSNSSAPNGGMQIQLNCARLRLEFPSK